MHWALFFTLVLKATAAPTSQDKRQHILYEAKDVKNILALSRPARNTGVINPEVPEYCESLEGRCSEISEPVCGTDGLTYHNKCKLKVASCYKPQDNVTIKNLGECQREQEPFIREDNKIADGNEILDVGNKNDEVMLGSNGCWYPVLNKVLPYGTIGYEKCIQKECQQDKIWQPTGEQLPNCDVENIKCWNWVTNETAPLESIMDFECNQYLCTEEDWQLDGERKSCVGCLSEATGEYLPESYKGYYKCEQFECLNDEWQETGERLNGCSVGEVKCWDWTLEETVPIDSEMIHNDIKLMCTEEDWQQIHIHASSDPETVGCLSEITNDIDQYGTKGYYLCEQFECLTNNTWHKTGEKLAGCTPGEMKCLDWYTNEIVPVGSIMFHKCIQYMCSDNDWKKTPIKDPSCLETVGCLSEITNDIDQYGTKGYYLCEQFECLTNNTWHKTGEKLAGCTSGEMKCLDWYTNEIVPVGSIMFHNCRQYLCSDNDWKKTSIKDPSCIGKSGCLCPVIKKVLPYGTKYYKKCAQMECKLDTTWQPTGEKLPNCEVGSMKCNNWQTAETVPLESTMYFECNNYLCTQDDWILNGERNLSCASEGCVSKVTNEIVAYDYKGYYKCEQIECLRNSMWENTGERLSGCSPDEMKCLDWYTNEIVPVGSIMFHKCIQYLCSDNDWEKTPNTDPSCLGKDGCWYPVINKVLPYGTKGYEKCAQMECKLDSTWQPTGERLPNCEVGNMKCINWQTGEPVPLESTMYFECNDYICTQTDWILNGERKLSCASDGCLSTVTNEIVSYNTKGYYNCEQFECLRNNTWQNTGEILAGCSNEQMKCWNWNLQEAVPINSVLDHNDIKYECTVEDWIPLSDLAFDEPEIDERIDVPPECVPGVTSEQDGQQCCCSEYSILDCNGPCEGPESTTMSIMDTKSTTMSEMDTPVEESMDPAMGRQEMETKEPESTTMSGMDTTTEGSSSSKKDIYLLLFLLPAVLFWI